MTPRTQQQRRDETRQALLDATVSSLLEVGFAKTTTLEVQRRAGVSRGALLHHFPSKADLLTAAALHLAEMRGRELSAMAERLPTDGARVGAVIDLLWESFTGPLFSVAIELRTAARTDDDFREVIAATERVLRDRILEQSRRLFGASVADKPGFECAFDMTLQLMIGAAMSLIVHHTQPGAEERSGADAARVLINRWKSVFNTLLEKRNE